MRSRMVNVSVARRYARALLELANETAGLEVVQQQLQALADAVTGSPELNDVVVNPVYTREQRTAVMDSVIDAGGGFHPIVRNFVRLLIDRNRLGYLLDIARLFRDMADALANRIRGKVITAVPMGEEPLRSLARKLKDLTDHDVILEAEVEPLLLGGMKAQVGSVVYDGSLRSQLEALRRSLKEGS